MIDPDSPVLDFDTPINEGGLLPPGLDAVVSTAPHVTVGQGLR